MPKKACLKKFLGTCKGLNAKKLFAEIKKERERG